MIKYINPYYISIVSFISYSLLQLYNIFIKKYKYEYSFLFVKVITHTLPLILSYYLIKDKDKYALLNLLIIISLYIIYMNYIDRNIYHTYLIYKPPLNWKEYFELCDTKEGKYIPYCFLYNNNNNNNNNNNVQN
jgi:hypothetical protein